MQKIAHGATLSGDRGQEKVANWQSPRVRTLTIDHAIGQSEPVRQEVLSFGSALVPRTTNPYFKIAAAVAPRHDARESNSPTASGPELNPCIVRLPKYSDHMTIEIREPSFFLLAALLDGPKHGYALISEVASLSEGRLTLQVGTLYGALERLEQQGWVAESGTEVVAGRHRKYFAITDDGVAALEGESQRLSARAARATALITRRREGFAS